LFNSHFLKSIEVKGDLPWKPSWLPFLIPHEIQLTLFLLLLKLNRQLNKPCSGWPTSGQVWAPCMCLKVWMQHQKRQPLQQNTCLCL